jgi:UDP-4-amino-4,6-dideoxy-N-acetyl-beta-L-altrosamine N-acetyltransferase
MNILEVARLKPISSEDLELIYSWRNQKHIRDVMFNDQPIGWEDHLAWFEKLEKVHEKMSLLFYLRNTPLGIVNFSLDLANEKCEWGFYIGNKEAPKGAGTIMGVAALNFIFKEINIRKVIGEVLDFNKKSLIFHEKLGFSFEGKSAINRNGKNTNIHRFAINKQEWESNKGNIKVLIEGIET